MQVSVEKLWDNTREISGGKLPVVIRAGDDAVKISNQFSGMFSTSPCANKISYKPMNKMQQKK